MKDRITSLTAILIIIFIAILLFAGIFAYWQYENYKTQTVIYPQVQNTATQNSKPETAGWKTYTNTSTKYGFTIKYPTDWPEPIESSAGEVNFDNRIFIHYYESSKNLPSDYYSQNKENIILPGGSYSAIKVQENYCMVLLTNEIFTQTNFESFDPSQEPIYSIEGPKVCDYKNNPELLSKKYSEMEVVYNQMVSTFKFFEK